MKKLTVTKELDFKGTVLTYFEWLNMCLEQNPENGKGIKNSRLTYKLTDIITKAQTENKDLILFEDSDFEFLKASVNIASFNPKLAMEKGYQDFLTSFEGVETPIVEVSK